MKKRTTPVLIAALVAAASLALGACGSGDDGGDTNNNDAKGEATFTPVTAGKLTVCTNPPYWPFEDTLDGEVVGLDLDLMAEVAKDLGLELQPKEMNFEIIESATGFETGDCDVGASALTITEARAAKMDFSEPYYESTMGMLVMADSALASLADVEGKPVGVQMGTTGEEWANEQAELTEIRQFEGLGDQVTALKSGEVEAVFNDVPALQPYADTGEMTIAADFQTGEKLGFAVKQGNTVLLDQINATLQRLKADGTFDQIVAAAFERAQSTL
ncbi:MAG: transporter substrate-binding domain-containing protein [Micrococcales bacterium]|nr:transporter substrate-binding domain-containing protein [Micrococcales bacterium]